MTRGDAGPGVPIEVRRYGERGPRVILVHGGPGAPGTMAPLALALAPFARVEEPLQRRSGGAPLGVARHVSDLAAVVAAGEPPAILGHSWGAMLALAFAAEHPGAARSLSLVGSGTWTEAARERLRATREARTRDADRAAIERILREEPDPDRRLARLGALYERLDGFDPVDAGRDPGEPFDARGHEETWADMLRLQQEGVYPSAFERVRIPAVMLHGADDPHPGRMIHASLAPWMPQLEYVEFERCGHVPWIERHAREPFLEALRARLEGLARP